MIPLLIIVLITFISVGQVDAVPTRYEYRATPRAVSQSIHPVVVQYRDPFATAISQQDPAIEIPESPKSISHKLRDSNRWPLEVESKSIPMPIKTSTNRRMHRMDSAESDLVSSDSQDSGELLSLTSFDSTMARGGWSPLFNSPRFLEDFHHHRKQQQQQQPHRQSRLDRRYSRFTPRSLDRHQSTASHYLVPTYEDDIRNNKW